MSTTPETIHWHDAGTDLPDSDRLVLCKTPKDGVCEGYFDGETDDAKPLWRDVNAWTIFAVTHWAEMPKGPV